MKTLWGLFQTPHTQYGASLYIKMCVCVSGHQNRFGPMNFSQNLLIISNRLSLSSTSQQQSYLMSMFHHSLYSQHNSRNPYLNKSLIVPQNSKFFKSLFYKKYVKLERQRRPNFKLIFFVIFVFFTFFKFLSSYSFLLFFLSLLVFFM